MSSFINPKRIPYGSDVTVFVPTPYGVLMYIRRLKNLTEIIVTFATSKKKVRIYNETFRNIND